MKPNRGVPAESVKKPYKAPVLIEYGALRELTAGGISGPAEGSMTGDLTRKP